MVQDTSPSVHAGNALSRDSELHIINHLGAILRVASASNGTTPQVTVDDTSPLTGTSLYTSSEPGMIVIVDASSGVGNTANITNVDTTNDVLTLDTDLSGDLADGDFVAVVPPMGSKIRQNGGHTIQATRQHDNAAGIEQQSVTHNTVLQHSPEGDVNMFCLRASEALSRMLAAAVGGYQLSSNQHLYRPFYVDDGNFTKVDGLTAYSIEGNNVSKQVYGPLVVNQWQLNLPQGGVPNFTFSVTGQHTVREVGGTGKTFPSGSSNWDRGSGIEQEPGSRHNFKGAFVEFGGSFGNALTDQGDQFLTQLTVTGIRDLTDDYGLGSQDRMRPKENRHRLEISGTRVFEDETVYQDYLGSSSDPVASQRTETRIFVKLIHPGATSRILDVDAPRGVFTSDDIQRQDGRIMENFTFEALQSEDSNNLPDTSTPLYQLTYDNGLTTDITSNL